MKAHSFTTMDDEETLLVKYQKTSNHKPQSVGRLIPTTTLHRYTADDKLAKHILTLFKVHPINGCSKDDIQSLECTDTMWAEMIDAFYWKGQLERTRELLAA